MTDSQYWAETAVNAWHPVEPPRWATAEPETWESERDRCRAMSRAARSHMPELVCMFDAWVSAWDRRHRAYSVVVEARNRAAVSAVVDEVDAEEARQAFRAARRAEEERRAIVALPWSSAAVVLTGGER